MDSCVELLRSCIREVPCIFSGIVKECSAKSRVTSLLAVLAVLNAPTSTLGEMTLIHRETFTTTGTLTSSSPGANFSSVEGFLHQRPGGPHLANGPESSVDLRENGAPAIGRFVFASPSNPRIFAGAWFLIKDVQGGQVDLLSICDPYGNLSPTISITGEDLGGGIRFNSFISSAISWKNRWIYLGIAAHLKSGTTADVRFYYKFPGQPMQSWAPINDGQIGIASFGQMFAGGRSFGPIVRGRLGAPAVYTFESDDFSDVAYPAELIEPNGRRVWYCDPLNGNDNADGASPATAWKTAAKINLESLFTGILPANSYEEGDTLIIDTTGQDLDLEGQTLLLSTPGLNVRAAQGQEWIHIKSYRSLPPSTWQTTGITNVFSTQDTQSSIVIWEDDKFLNHALGSSLAAVAAQLSTTPGSFWTDGTTLYLHPFGDTDPRSDGKRYERSYNFAEGGAVVLGSPNLNIQDIRSGKTCLARATDNDPIGGYPLGFAAPPGRTVVKHCYLYYGSKHIIGIVQGSAGDDVLIEDVQAEQASPYAAPGGQTAFVSFNHQPVDLHITHRFHRCRTIANAGLIGSSAGVMTQLYPVYFCHNLGDPGEPDQFDRFEFIDCDFGIGNIQGDGVKTVYLRGTRCGSVDMDSQVSADRCSFQGMNRVDADYSLTERNCIHEISGELQRNPIAGNIDIQFCTFDARQVTGIQGGVPQSSLLTREAQLNLLFQNNVVLMPASVPAANVFSTFQSTDSLQLRHNAYSLGTSTLAYQFNDGSTVQDRSFSQWQTLGYDTGSSQPANMDLLDLRPQPGSPLINAALDFGPLEDFTGHQFYHRNDIGAYELPPITFNDWQLENFTAAERANPSVSSDQAVFGGDGMPNILKYAFGMNAVDSRPNPLTHSLQTNSGESPAIVDVIFERSRWPSDLTFTLQVSSNLVNWYPANILDEEILSQSDHTESIHTSILCPQPGRCFIQLQVSRAAAAP